METGHVLTDFFNTHRIAFLGNVLWSSSCQGSAGSNNGWRSSP